jgi:hypothetical protein
MKNFIFIPALAISLIINAQKNLTIEGQRFTDTNEQWNGVYIPRSEPTDFTFKNNLITSVNKNGYMLQAGDEQPGITNNNLAGAIITGNKLIWNGTSMTSITHGIFTGCNVNVTIKYNYCYKVPMAIICKSGNSMQNKSGGIAYNIIISPNCGIPVKGISGLNIFNNTFYQDRSESQTNRELINVYTNTDNGLYSVSHNTKIYNNIFYTKFLTTNIRIDDTESLNGFECDYNIYWCEKGDPVFEVAGESKTWEQWRNLGFDKHSVLINPDFLDLINFIPAKRLDYGTVLGSKWKEGLSLKSTWGSKDPDTKAQNGTWQVGARIYGSCEKNNSDNSVIK